MLWVEKDECGDYGTCIELRLERAIAKEKRKAISMVDINILHNRNKYWRCQNGRI